MGHKTNPIGFRLGLTTLWREVFVTCINKYKQVFQKASIIKEICKNYFTNYSVPEFVPGTLRNDKKLEQKDRKIQSNMINNSFVANNMIYADTTVIRAKELDIQNAILDGGQLEKKTNEIKDLKKTDASYLKPKMWKRHLARSLLNYKNALKRSKKRQIEYYKPKKQKKININVKSFNLAFKIKTTAQQLKKNENKSNPCKTKLKIFFKPKKYILKTSEISEYYLVLNAKVEEQDNNVIALSTKPNITSYLNSKNLDVNPITCYTENEIYNTNSSILNISLHQINFSFIAFIRNKTKNHQIIHKTKKNSVIRNRLRRLKRYPLILHQIFAKQKNKLHILSGGYKFNVLKCFIKGFNTMRQTFSKARLYFLFMFKELLTGLLTFIGNIPQMFVLSMLTNLILQETAQKHHEILERRNFFSYRYLIYQCANAALIGAINSIEKKFFVRFSFLGLHTRNMSANLLKNYILQKLSQYFTIQEILKPIIYDLKTSPLLYGFRIIVAGRITRKERAAFLIKNFNNLPLNKKAAKIDYATGARIQKFGMVGIKVFLYKNTTKVSYYNYKFRNKNIYVI